MTDPVGLFVSVEGLSKDELRKMFDKILEDHHREGTPFYINNLVLAPVASKDQNGAIRLYKERLDWIKDYFHYFGNIFVGGAGPLSLGPGFDPFRDGIKDDDYRWGHINDTREVANQFIQYYHENNLTGIAIHWYINYEADLNYFSDSDGSEITDKYTWYLMEVTKEFTEISINSGLNKPEYFWSPYFGKGYSEENKDTLIARIKSLLQNASKLTWLHVQDGVGAHAIRHSDGTIAYELGHRAEDAIKYHWEVLAPADDGHTLLSNLLNMEYFVCSLGQDGRPDCTRKMYPGDPGEHDDRICQYKQAGVFPVGVSFEIRYWYAARYGN